MAWEEMFLLIPGKLLLTGHRWMLTPDKNAFKCFAFFFTPIKARQGHRSWCVTQSGEDLTAINSSERNQIWRTGGGNWCDHTYPYGGGARAHKCVASVCVGTERHTIGSDLWNWRWNQTDIMQTGRQTSRQNSGKAAEKQAGTGWAHQHDWEEGVKQYWGGCLE